jgi:hypothetical protein
MDKNSFHIRNPTHPNTTSPRDTDTPEGNETANAGRLLPWLILAIQAIVMALVVLVTPGCSTTEPANEPSPSTDAVFWPSSMCRNCHINIAEQHGGSLHAALFTNPVFQDHFVKEFLPLFHESIDEIREKSPCMACHAPMAYLQSDYHEAKKISMEFAERRPCDRCHKSHESKPERHRQVSDTDDEEIWRMTLGRAPEREKLYTHPFVGAASRSQIEGAVANQNRARTFRTGHRRAGYHLSRFGHARSMNNETAVNSTAPERKDGVGCSSISGEGNAHDQSEQPRGYLTRRTCERK